MVLQLQSPETEARVGQTYRECELILDVEPVVVVAKHVIAAAVVVVVVRHAVRLVEEVRACRMWRVGVVVMQLMSPSKHAFG